MIAKAEMLIRRPVAEVFEAFTDPAITTKFWFTKSSGRLELGKQVRWEWEMYNASSDVHVKEIEPNKRILVEWGEPEQRTIVEWLFTPRADNTTFVSITNSGFQGTQEEVAQQAIDATEGFTLVLAGLKAYLEHKINLNLIVDRFPVKKEPGMNMKEHILMALREQFESWEELLERPNEEQITTPQFDLAWSIKDVMAHLWAWQQISIARMESGVQNREPEYPKWMTILGEDWEENADGVNAQTFENNHEKPWAEVYRNWKDGFLQFLELGKRISERDLLNGDRYPWLKGYSLAFILVASYEHHQEHFEKLTDWL